MAGAAVDDAAINADRGIATAEVLDSSFSRTLIRFPSANGQSVVPERGVQYPRGLATGDTVVVEYALSDPEQVRVAGRSVVDGVVPVLPGRRRGLGGARPAGRVAAPQEPGDRDRAPRATGYLDPAAYDGVAGSAMSRADLDKDPHDVAAMFDGVARRYDLTNTVLTAGQDRRWRGADPRARSTCGPASACWTSPRGRPCRPSRWPARAPGASPPTSPSACCAPGAARAVPKVAADALALPFADAAFDAVTISFGLRNVADPDAALAEMARVTRPGGRLVVCEFGTPTWAPYRAAYHDVVPEARAAGGRPCGVEQPRGLPATSPSRSAPGPRSPRWRTGSRSAGLDRRRLAEPRGRRRRPAPRPPGRSTRAR